jgi:SMI1 / KNR4 family (SUKH-1)
VPFDLPEASFEALEDRLAARLPQSYRSAMLGSNGGEICMSGDVWQLHPIEDKSDRKRLSRSANHVIRQTQECQEWPNFSPIALVIASNGSGDQLIFLKGADTFGPEVYLWAHETGKMQKVADDFSEFLV